MTSRLRVLERALVLERTATALESVVEELVERYRRASVEGRTAPDSLELLDGLREAGISMPRVPRAINYLQRCIRDGTTPDPSALFRILLPEAPSPFFPEPEDQE